MRHESGVDASPCNTATCRNALWASKPTHLISSFTDGSFVCGSAASALTHGSWFLTNIRVAALTGRHKRRDRSQAFHPVCREKGKPITRWSPTLVGDFLATDLGRIFRR